MNGHVMTRHGKSAAVMLDVSGHAGLVRGMDIIEDIRLAEQQLAGGRGVPHRRALKDVLARAKRCKL